MRMIKIKWAMDLAVLAITGLCCAPTALWAETKAAPRQVTQYAPNAKQDLQLIKQHVNEFLLTQTLGYPGQVFIDTGSLDPNLKLAECADVNVFLANGSRAWGKTNVGVRCNAPTSWTVYMQATVKVQAQYLVAAAPLAQGQVVSGADLMVQEGDLTQLPAGVFTESARAVGRTVHLSVAAGTVLRQDMLKQSPVVVQGQTVTLHTIGHGFSISAEGQAMAKATDGQVVQVKMANGQIVSGIARTGAKVEVTY